MRSRKLRITCCRMVYLLSCCLAVAELTLIIGSWIVNAMLPDSGVSSFLSSEGIRWFIGGFSSFVLSPYLSWIILIGMAYGVFSRSGLRNATYKSDSFQLRLGYQVAVVVFSVLVLALVLLAFLPHAILVNASGKLLHSSFSRGLVPAVCFIITVTSFVYGVCIQRFRTAHSVFSAMKNGITVVTPLFVLYIFFILFYRSLLFVYNFTFTALPQ